MHPLVLWIAATESGETPAPGNFAQKEIDMNLGDFAINDVIDIFTPVIHAPATGIRTNPTVLTYSIYEDGNAVPLADDVDLIAGGVYDSKVGLYKVSVTASAANGYESGKKYLVLFEWTVTAISQASTHTFTIQKGQIHANAALVANGLDNVPTLAEMATAAAADILVTPANLIATDASGQVVAASVQGSITGDVAGHVLGNVTGNVGGNVTGSVGSLGTTAIANVKAATAAFFGDPTTEPTGPPTATGSLLAKLLWGMMRWISGVEQTASEDRVKNDAGAVVGKATTSDAGGVTSRGKYLQGP
jgi:hypothetical protein